MPGLDRTGPEGQGSRTGRQMGKCASKPEESNSKDLSAETETGRPVRGFGRGRGRRFGRGYGKGPGRNNN